MTERDLEGPTATVADTRTALLTSAKRPFVPIRRTFVQTPRTLAADKNDLRGPLAWFVTSKNHRALLAYLLALGTTSSGDGPHGWSTSHHIQVWARYFGTTDFASGTSASNAVSKIFTKLEGRNLITRGRKGRERKIAITLLREDGTGDDYTRPDGKALPDRFLKVPHELWTDGNGWSEKLTLPALAMLLVLLHEKAGARLPTEKMPAWYGWSADTAERGLKELDDHGLLHKVRRREKAPTSPLGYTIVNYYYLQPPFGSPPPFTISGLAEKKIAEILAATSVEEIFKAGT
jgi:hypothetical protein